MGYGQLRTSPECASSSHSWTKLRFGFLHEAYGFPRISETPVLIRKWGRRGDKAWSLFSLPSDGHKEEIKPMIKCGQCDRLNIIFSKVDSLISNLVKLSRVYYTSDSQGTSQIVAPLRKEHSWFFDSVAPVRGRVMSINYSPGDYNKLPLVPMSSINRLILKDVRDFVQKLAG